MSDYTVKCDGVVLILGCSEVPPTNARVTVCIVSHTPCLLAMCGLSRQLVRAAYLLVVIAGPLVAAVERPDEQLLCQLPDQQPPAAWEIMSQLGHRGICPADITAAGLVLNATDADSSALNRGSYDAVPDPAASIWETVIVRFKKYKMVWEHKSALSDVSTLAYADDNFADRLPSITCRS